MRWLLLVVGVVAVLVGIIWTLQGLNILGGSVMSGRSVFAVLGVVIGIAGLVLIGIGTRRLGARGA